MIMLLNWLLTIITFGTFSLATITMTNVDEYTYETVTDSKISLNDLFGNEQNNIAPNMNEFSIGTSLIDSYITNDMLYIDSAGSISSSLNNGAYIIDFWDSENGHSYYISYYGVWESGQTDMRMFYPSNNYHTLSSTLSRYSYVNTLAYGGYGNTFAFGTYTSGGKIGIELEYILDLTAIYGSGNEPTANEIDTWYGLYQTALTTNQHEYTYTLNTIDLEDIVVLVSSAFMWYVAIKLFREVI